MRGTKISAVDSTFLAVEWLGERPRFPCDLVNGLNLAEKRQTKEENVLAPLNAIYYRGL